MNATRQVKPLVPPQTIVVPLSLAVEIETLVQALAARTGEPLEDVRRAVEVTILKWGLESLKAEEAKKR